MTSRGRLTAVVVGVGLLVVLLRMPLLSAHQDRAVDDLAQLVAAATGAVCCAWRARRSSGPTRASWWLMAAAAGAWAGGETIWSYYELLSRRETPFPSAADVGFLLFPLLAGLGLLRWPSRALVGGARWRTLLDGTLIAGSLFLVTWTTALGSAVRAGAGGAADLGYWVSVAYPVGDLVLLTVTVVVVAHARRVGRSALFVLALGLASLSVADSGFAYLTALGTYRTGSIVDAGWVAGFLLMAVAALHPVDEVATPTAVSGPALARNLLPYLPAGVGLAAALISGLFGTPSTTTLVASAVVVAALLGRQLVAVAENQRLVRQVLLTQQELHHQAFHDPLTGLANRALFVDRLRHGLELHRRDLRPLSVLYCDLDGFKTVNDGWGHDAGDDVLRAAAERLQAVTRRADTVARLGGDEFAILLEDGGDATMVAGRILEGFVRPMPVDSESVSIGVSIGIAHLHAADATLPAAELLRRADEAMYQAKRGGKGSAVTWQEATVSVLAS